MATFEAFFQRFAMVLLSRNVIYIAPEFKKSFMVLVVYGCLTPQILPNIPQVLYMKMKTFKLSPKYKSGQDNYQQKGSQVFPKKTCCEKIFSCDEALSLLSRVHKYD